MFPTRLIGLSIVLAALAPAALAQAPGQIPGTLPPAPPVIAPPPPVAPAPVPSALMPLPQPSMGIPRNINSGPVISSGGGTVRSTYYGDPARKKKRWKKHRRPRVSSY
jgi:hypothetical protein